MATAPGIFIALEGADGSGKGTQFKLLAERLRAAGHDIALFDFPRYDQPSSHFVQKYLTGEYGPAAEVSPYTASLFYALDRYEASSSIKKELSAGKVVLSNRYTGSNMAHQGSKFSRPAERRGFFMWADALEYDVLGIPRPTLNIFLRVPAEVSYKLIGQKVKRSYTNATHDQHEGDLSHLQQSVAAYDLICKLFPRDFSAIDCTQDGQLLSVPQISELIWQKVKPLLPPPPRRGRPRTIKFEAASSPQPPIARQPDRQLHDTGYYLPPRLKENDLKYFRDFISQNARARAELQALVERVLGQKKSSSRTAIDEVQALTQPLAAFGKSKVETVTVDQKRGSADDGALLLHGGLRNEFDLLQKAGSKSGELDYPTKQKQLKQKLDKDASSRRQATYVVDVLANTLVIKELTEKKILTELKGEPPTDRRGFQIPDIIESSNLTDHYTEIFDKSQEAFKKLRAHRVSAAGYVLLAGHRRRWQFSVNADSLSKIGKLKPASQAVLAQIIEKISENHPIIGEYLSKQLN